MSYQLSLRHTPVILERIIDEIPTDRLGDAPVEGRFGLLEMVAHMADFEDIFVDRMRGAIEQDVPVYEGIDVGQRAIEKNYLGRNLREELEVFASRRLDSMTFIEELTDEQLAREFVSSMGRISVKDYVAVVAGHDLYHLEQASGYLKVLP